MPSCRLSPEAARERARKAAETRRARYLSLPPEERLAALADNRRHRSEAGRRAWQSRLLRAGFPNGIPRTHPVRLFDRDRRALARLSGDPKMAVSGLLALHRTLERAGAVEWVDHPSVRFALTPRLTPAGVEWAEAARREWEAKYTTAAANLDRLLDDAHLAPAAGLPLTAAQLDMLLDIHPRPGEALARVLAALTEAESAGLLEWSPSRNGKRPHLTETAERVAREEATFRAALAAADP